MKLVPLEPVKTTDMLKVLEDLRKKIESGEVIGFCAVGIDPADETLLWMATSQRVTRLRMMGAVANLAHHINSGEL